jgi:hypothetical protein
VDQYKPNPILEQLNEEPPQIKAHRELQKRQIDEVIELQRLCFEIFHMTDMGKKLYQLLLNKMIIPAKFSPTDANAPHLAIYWSGFKDALRGLHEHGEEHQRRINEGHTR